MDDTVAGAGDVFSIGVAVDDTVAGAGDVFSNTKASSMSVAKAGTTGDGGNTAVHPSYPTNSLRDEYLSSKKALYSAVTLEASTVNSISPEKDSVSIDCTETMNASTKGTGDCVCLTQSPFTNDVDVTE